MPTIVARNSSLIAGEVQSNVNSSPQKRILRSDSATQGSPMKLKSPRRCINDSPSTPAKVSSVTNFPSIFFDFVDFLIVCDNFLE